MLKRWAYFLLAMGLSLAAWPASFVGDLVPNNLMDKRPLGITAAGIFILFAIAILLMLLRDLVRDIPRKDIKPK